ncbi:hypothetical protein EV361DRAFT_768360, partial [Lentinula raphanica]
ITAHKAQGATYQHAVLDLESCSGTERPYVMVSRVKSLDGLVILRPFRRSKIMSRQSQDVRMEIKRLEALHIST